RLVLIFPPRSSWPARPAAVTVLFRLHPPRNPPSEPTRMTIPAQISRRAFLQTSTMLLGTTWANAPAADEAPYDLLVRNGKIVDGTGNPWFDGDLAIRGDRIAAVGQVRGAAKRTIDAQGLVVAPGFIDMHSHSD